MRSSTVKIDRSHDLELQEHGSEYLVYQSETTNFSVVHDVLARLSRGVFVHRAGKLDLVEREVRSIEIGLDQTDIVLQDVC